MSFNSENMNYIADNILRALNVCKENKNLWKTDKYAMIRLIQADNPKFYELYPRIPSNGRLIFLSRIILITPSAALRSAYGSFEPVGFSSIAQKPTSVSSLSASPTATDTGSVGATSFGPCGL